MAKTELSIKIKEFLKDGPASINDVCKEMKISWATAKSFLEDMQEKEEVKEIVSNPKIRIFKLSNDPAFYGVPLSKEQKEQAIFLFQNIRKEWKEKEEKKKGPLLTTTLQKIAVDVAKECNCNIPAVSFHYGLVVPVIDTPFFEYSIPNNSKQILQTIKRAIQVHTNRSIDERISQYKKYSMKLFESKENLKFILRSCEKIDSKKAQQILSRLFIDWPTDNKNPEVFDLYYDFSDKVFGLIITQEFKEHIEDVNEAFNILWDFVTTYLFFKEMEKYVKDEKKEVFDYIKSSQLLAKKANVEERINYLSSLTNLNKEIRLPSDEESISIRRILAEGAEEE